MDIYLFVLSYLIQLAASGILLHKVWKVRSIFGLSKETQVCFLFATLSRCVWSLNTRILDTNHILSLVALFELFTSVAASLFLMYSFYKFHHTTTVHAPRFASAYVMVPLAFVVALFFNPGESLVFTSQVLVAFTMYVEALALVPQLWILRKMADVEALTSHYIGLLIVSRMIRMVFWVVMFRAGTSFRGLFVADLLHTLFSADYLYLWVRKLRYGGRLVYSL
jgi:ER lumen protein retaining receptor